MKYTCSQEDPHEALFGLPVTCLSTLLPSQVTSRLTLRRRPSAPPQDLVLDGEDLILKHLILNGKLLKHNPRTGYFFPDDDKLQIPKQLLPAKANVAFELLIGVSIDPADNPWRKGLFTTQNSFVTQCEPGGFRRITYFLDRPDILTRYRVRQTNESE